MGMFDRIDYEAPCPICSRPLNVWQSKDAGCCLGQLTPGELWQQSTWTRRRRGDQAKRSLAPYAREVYTSFYADCEDCGTWVEIRLSSGHLAYTDEDYQRMRSREPLENRRGPIIPELTADQKRRP